jgi:stress response protein SCP2
MATTPKCNNGWQTCECTVTRCSKYDGDNLTNTGIKTGDTVTVALQKVDNALNPLTITQTILTTLQTNLTLQAQFCNIVNSCVPEEILLQEDSFAILQEDGSNILL